MAFFVPPQCRQTIKIAEAQVGKPYAYGAAGPGAFDCSGLVRYCYKQLGIELYGSSQDLFVYGFEAVNIYDPANWKAADIIFVNNGVDEAQPGHCQLVINGKFNTVVEALNPAVGVRRGVNWAGIPLLNTTAGANQIMGIRRVIV